MSRVSPIIMQVRKLPEVADAAPSIFTLSPCSVSPFNGQTYGHHTTYLGPSCGGEHNPVTSDGLIFLCYYSWLLHVEWKDVFQDLFSFDLGSRKSCA